MNWIGTHIRFPEDQYMKLKMDAVRKRKSVGAMVRQGLGMEKAHQKFSPKETRRLMERLERVARETARQNPGLNLTRALIEMRYEQ